jgi:signal transduction histidine kinase
VDCAPLDEPVYVDREMWEKIVLNLLSNALKFTFEGEIEIGLERRLNHVILKVCDTGTGIPGAELPHIFKRFYRVKNARGRSFEGSGIGLALVQELVKLHGGTVEVDSAMGRGTRFTVSIPAGKSHLPAERIQASQTLESSGIRGEAFVEEAMRWLPGEDWDIKLPRSSAEITDALELRNLAARIEDSTPAFIIFADDNADMRTYVKRLLSPLYEVTTVSNGALALKAARERKPDLILADVMMPELDGFELLKQLRADTHLNRTPIILLSARAGEESRIEGMEAGADDYLIKPFSARELLTRAKAHLEIARARTQAEEQLRNTNEALRQSEARLELIVAERTRDLQQANAALVRDMAERKKLEEQLLQSQKMESIAALAGGVAHDFNNILNIIQAYNSLMSQHSGTDKEIQESVAVISQTIKRGTAVVQQLLTAARKDSGTEFRSIDAHDLIEKFLPLIKETFPKTIAINYSAEPHLPRITADQNQIEQALLNLCVNARDAMPDGGVLTLRTHSVDGTALQFPGDSQGTYVCIEVTDNGTGIDEAIRKRIFEPFFTTKDIGQGTGLGLSVVFGIVKNHTGFVEVASELGSGTTFRLYFPVASRETADNEAATKRDESLAPFAEKATLLLVEDEENMRRLLEKTFSRRGYRILTADTGQSALELYHQHKKEIDVVLLDMGLPQVSGREVLKKIRLEDPNAKIIVTSGYIEPGLKSEIDSAHVKLLHKPYSQNDLFALVQRLIAE